MSLRAALFAACIVLFFPAIARAQDKAACLRSHVHGQELRIAGKWRAARGEFATCSAASCPAALSKDCVGWNAELAEKIPTVLVVAHTPAGEDTLDASLDVDDEHRSDALSGSAIDLDPGEHVLVLRHAGWSDVSKHVVLREGDREHRVEVSFTALPPPISITTRIAAPELMLPPKKKGLPVASVVLTVLGALAVGTGVVLDVSGGADYNLGCYGHCSTPETNSINARFLAGDVTFVAGVVTLGVALIIALVQRR